MVALVRGYPSEDSGDSGGQTQLHVGEEMWLLGTGASGHFTHDSIKLVGYAECNRTLRCAGGATYPIVGTGSVEIHLRSGGGGWGVVVTVRLLGVGHVPGLSYHLVSLRLIADAGNCYTGTSENITIIFSKSGDEIFSPVLGN